MKILWGYSFSQPEFFSQFRSGVPAPLSILEIPGALLDSAANIPHFNALRKKGIRLCARDLIAPEIAGLIPEENCKLRSELEHHFAGRCACAAEAGIVSLSCIFDLTGALKSEESNRLLAVFLKRCAGVIARFNQTLRLQLRVPAGNGTPEWNSFYQLRRNLLCPNINWCIELFPHEPGMKEQLEQIVPLFRGYDRFRRICYNPEIGNILTPAALRCCCRTAPGPVEPLTLLLESRNTPLDPATLETLACFKE